MSAGPTRVEERRVDRIRPGTRWLAILILPFLIVAVVLLYVLPGGTEQHFAWTIAPPLTAMFLGSAYAGGVWFFVQVVRLRSWHRVRHGFPAVVVFATLLGAATITHWDRFHFGHVSFITWLILYLTTPVLVLAALLSNRSADPGTPEPTDVAVPRWIRMTLAAIGVLALVAGLTLFIAPTIAIEVWAWELTPLTARVVGAILTLPGMVNIWMIRDSRWTAFRFVVQAELVSLVFIVGALLLARDDLEWSRPAAPIFVTGITVSLIVFGAFYASFERRMKVVAGA